jgi:hypothetical protein
MNRFLGLFAIAALASLGLSGCYPGGADFTEDLDLVYTNYDDAFDFDSRNTYALPDKIVVDIEINEITGDTTFVYMKDIYAEPILARIDANMADYGWQKVDVSADPDVLVMPAGVTNTTFIYYYWYGWWYYGYWPGWGWYYPPYWGVSSYTTGTLLVTMADPNIDSPINRSQTAWLMAGNGLLDYSGNIDRVLGAVDQAFQQSPYLNKN